MTTPETIEKISRQHEQAGAMKLELVEVGDRIKKLVPISIEARESLLTIVSEKGIDFAAVYDDEMARFIIRACNNFEGLLDALKECRRELYHCNRQLVDRGYHAGGSVMEALGKSFSTIQKAEADQ
ncbi:MAG: hypothetical protein ACYDG4_13405 [Desulfuromonadaceae bacterium]